MGLAVLHAAPSSPHTGSITFGPAGRSKGSWVGPVTVAYDGDNWGVELDMIEAYTSDMVAFFEQIAASDWNGSAAWQSEFAEISVVAERTTDGLTALAFSLWWSRGDELDNTREGTLHVRTEELPEFAKRLRDLTEVTGAVRRFRQT